MDDFLHLLYLELHKDKEDEIAKLNANSNRQNFQSLKDLTDSNYKYFNGKYPFYLRTEQLKDSQDQFSFNPENDRYFRDKNDFKFKNFLPLSEVAEKINHSREVNIFKDRAFYLWKEFSSFVHYSNFSFYLEMNTDPANLHKIDEAFQYCYNSIYLSFKYFERNLSVEFINDDELQTKYGIIYKC